MRNPITLVRAATKPADQPHPPVPYVSRSGGLGGGLLGGSGGMDRGAQLGAMAANSTAYAVVDVLANPTALVHWRLFRIAASGKEEDREEIFDHPALTLWRKPNPFMVRALFCETVNQHYELTGLGAMALYKVGTLPVQMWPVRPDRLSPRPDANRFLAGWIYQSPDGEKVPLGVDEVLFIRTPNPTDPYGGLAPFGSLSPDMDSARYAALWNRNFFINSAEPGGVIQYPEVLPDDKFETIQKRWREQHRGVAAAHRVAIIEGGEWVDRNVSHKDMAFVDLDKRAGEKIMEAKRVNKHMLGITEDVNRAVAEASAVIHGQWQMVPRLERWKQLLNYELLPMFGEVTGRGFEFDYDSPVPEDREAERQDLTARVDAWVKLVTNGAEPDAAASIAGLPEVPMAGADSGTSPRQIAEMVQKIYLGVGTVITWEEARAVLVAAGADLNLSVPPPSGAAAIPVQARATRLDALPPAPVGAPTPAAGPAQDSGPRAEQAGKPDIDLEEVQAAWEQQLEQLLAVWGPVLAAWQADLLAQIRAAIDSGKVDKLTRLSLDSEEAAGLVAEHMTDLAQTAAERVVREAERQGVDGLEATVPKPRVIEDQAAVTAGLLAAGLAIAAGREAMRVNAPDLDGNQVADKVAEFLAAMSDATTRASLGGALTGAQNKARIETFRSGPIASLYADEKLDSNTCVNCRAIDGRYIGSTEDGTTMAEVEKLYPMGGYVDCLGRDRCRGTITGVWRKGGGDD